MIAGKIPKRINLNHLLQGNGVNQWVNLYDSVPFSISDFTVAFIELRDATNQIDKCLFEFRKDAGNYIQIRTGLAAATTGIAIDAKFGGTQFTNVSDTPDFEEDQNQNWGDKISLIALSVDQTNNRLELYKNGSLYKKISDPAITGIDFLNAVMALMATHGGAAPIKSAFNNFVWFSKILTDDEHKLLHRQTGHVPSSLHLYVLPAHLPLTQNHYHKADAGFIAKYPNFALGDHVAFDTCEQFNYAKPDDHGVWEYQYATADQLFADGDYIEFTVPENLNNTQDWIIGFFENNPPLFINNDPALKPILSFSTENNYSFNHNVQSQFSVYKNGVSDASINGVSIGDIIRINRSGNDIIVEVNSVPKPTITNALTTGDKYIIIQPRGNTDVIVNHNGNPLTFISYKGYKTKIINRVVIKTGALEARHAKLINFSDAELGIPNPSSQTAIRFDSSFNQYLRVPNFNPTPEKGYSIVVGFQFINDAWEQDFAQLIAKRSSQAPGSSPTGLLYFVGQQFPPSTIVIRSNNTFAGGVNNATLYEYPNSVNLSNWQTIMTTDIPGKQKIYTQGVKVMEQNFANNIVPGFDEIDGDLFIGSDDVDVYPTSRKMNGYMSFLGIAKGEIPHKAYAEFHNNTLIKGFKTSYNIDWQLLINFNAPYDDAGTLKFPDLSPQNHTIIAESDPGGWDDLPALQNALTDMNKLR